MQVRDHRHLWPDTLGSIVQWREVVQMQYHGVKRA